MVEVACTNKPSFRKCGCGTYVNLYCTGGLELAIYMTKQLV